MASERSFLRRLWSLNSQAPSVVLPGCGSPKEEVRSKICIHSCMRPKGKCFEVQSPCHYLMKSSQSGF